MRCYPSRLQQGTLSSSTSMLERKLRDDTCIWRDGKAEGDTEEHYIAALKSVQKF